MKAGCYILVQLSKIVNIDYANCVKTRTEDGRLRISIPIRIRQRGGRKEIILPEGVRTTAGPRSPESESLVMALVRAHYWVHLVETGAFPSLGKLAAALKLDRSYVCKIVQLTSLAPDIAQAILDGREPDELTLKHLRKGVPLLWDQQRQQYGFSANN